MAKIAGGSWSYTAVKLLAASAVATLAAILVTAAVFALTFRQSPWPHSLNAWASFGSYAGSMLQAFVGALAILAVILASIIFTEQANKRREDEDRAGQDRQRDEERTRTALSLSNAMRDQDFYIKVVAPSWEIAAKWLYWTGPEGDRYRQDVVAGIFPPSVKRLWSFRTEQEAAGLRYQNVLRFMPHYEPPDWNRRNRTITHLSEHMVLVIWIGFWSHIYWLDSEDLVSRKMIRSLFRDWYASWLPFMLQLRLVGVALAESAAWNDTQPAPGRNADKSQVAVHLEAIESILYLQSDELLHPDLNDSGRADKYRAEQKEAERTAKTITLSILTLHAQLMSQPVTGATRTP